MQIAIGIRVGTSGFEDDPVLPEPGDNALLLALNFAAPGSALPMPDAVIGADELALLLDAYDWSV